MKITGHFLSPTRQAEIHPSEAASRSIVGFTCNYPAGLPSGMHTHPRAQLLYATSGVMRVDTQDTSYLVPPTTALFLPANVEHAISMDGPVAMRALFMQEEIAVRVANVTKVIAISGLLRELILAVCNETVEWEPEGRGYYLTELVLDEIGSAEPLPLGLHLPSDARLLRVVEGLLKRPHDRRNLEEWSDVACASSRTLARLFRAETGMSFRQWRQQARLTAALSALSIGSSPARAASISGFDSVPAFGAAFRGLFGITPGQARRLYFGSRDE